MEPLSCVSTGRQYPFDRQRLYVVELQFSDTLQRMSIIEKRRQNITMFDDELFDLVMAVVGEQPRIGKECKLSLEVMVYLKIFGALIRFKVTNVNIHWNISARAVGKPGVAS